MNSSTVAMWSILILGELLLISLGLNLFSLRRRWWTTMGRPPRGLIQFVEAVAAKAQALKEGYRGIIGGSEADAPARLEGLQTQEKALEKLLQAGLTGQEMGHDRPYATLLQPLWNDMRESHALLDTAMKQLLGRTQLLHELMERMTAQEHYIQELNELSATYQRAVEELFEGPLAGQPLPEALAQLKDRHRLTQGKLQELEAKNQALLANEEQARSLFEVLRALKLEHAETEETLRTQQAQIQELSHQKEDVEREAERLQEQLQHANDQVQQLTSELEHMTAEYLKLFKRSRS